MNTNFDPLFLFIEQMNKFYQNLMSQNRKRTHESTGESGNKTAGNENTSSADSSPHSKRSLLNNQKISNLKPGNQGTLQRQSGSQARLSSKTPQKSMRPTQSINLLNAPEEIYYVANRNLK